MKINLLLNDINIRNGYENIDPFADGTDSRERGDVAILDDVVDDAECDEIIASDIIDFIASHQRYDVIKHWVSKLRHGGSITVGGVDIMLVAKSVACRQIDIHKANELLYGEQNAPWQYRKGTMTISLVSQMMADFGLKVIQRRTRGFHYLVTGERP